MIIEVVLNTVLCVHQSCLRVETCIDEQLLLIDDFLHRTCQITATYADTLNSHHPTGAGRHDTPGNQQPHRLA